MDLKSIMIKDLVSIITPTYNSSQFIKETINSILNQSYTNWELLITDDCSTDNSIEIISQYAQQDSRIKLFCLSENSGAGIARNNSIKYAKGRFIAFCDSDDKWLPEKLEKQVAFMLKHEYALVYSSYFTCTENGKLEGKVLCRPEVSYYDLVKENCIGCLTAMYDTKRLGKIYMPTIRKRQDWALWLITLKQCRYAYGILDPLAIYRLRRNSLSSNRLNLISYNIKIYRDVLYYSI
ncbi:putative teichuronic acid biosynthesis glycosyltransferase TuaG, partial [termite gut metagenome]